jgi:DNA-binding GntR family transcriptional regulator
VRHATYRNLPFTKETGRHHDELLVLMEQGDAAGVFAAMRAHMLDVGRNVMSASGWQQDVEPSAEVA